MIFGDCTILDSVIIYIAFIQMSLRLRILLILKSLLRSYLDLHIEIDKGGRLKTKLNDKRDDFTFPIVNFPFISINIPASPDYGVYISQLIRYYRACAQYSNILDRVQLLTHMLLKQGYVAPRLISSQQNSTVDITIWLTVTHFHISNDNGSFTFSVDVFFPLSLSRLLPDLAVYVSSTTGV